MRDGTRSTTTNDTSTGRDEGPPALELLVHGVGGATPQDMLTDPRTTRVTGDETAGVYRRIDDGDAEERPHDYRAEPVREAYCWSNLTSGNGARALWLLLLPFMVANLAHWMRPPAASRRDPRVRAYGLLVRLVALSLTVLLVAGACEVVLDLFAWQCAGTESCVADRSWLGFMSAEDGGWWSQPGRRLALAAVLPAALTGLLWYLSNRTWSAYESQEPAGRPVGEDDPAAGDHPALRLPGFWYGRRLVARLRAAHTAAGFLTVAAAVTAAAARHDRRPGGSTALDVAGWLLAALLAAGALVVLSVVCRRGRSENRMDQRLDRLTITALPGAALGCLALALLYAGWSRPGWSSRGRLPGDGVFGALVLLQVALVIGLAGCALVLHRAAPTPRTPLKGLGGPTVAMLACGLGGVLAGGVAQRVADWIDGGATPGMPGAPMPGPPVLLSWQAAVVPVLLGVLVLMAGVVALRVWRVRGREIHTVPHGYPGERPDGVRTRRIAGAVARAGATDDVPTIVGPVALCALLLGACAVAGAWGTGEVPGRAADDAPGVVDAAAETAQALGSWLMGLAFLTFVTWARRAYRSPSARRTVGILWDVGTFWPRAAHPLAPPCYAERAVPDLTWRMRTWTEQTGGRLVISGHSQGSVLAAAAVWQLDREARGRVALLTYGSPLERLYGRWFPAYFGPGPLRALHREVRCWRNLWRYTDPIGGPIRLPAGAGADVDCGAFKDPLAYGRTPEHPLPAPILGHSDYQADPAFDRERAALLARLPAPTRHPAPAPAGDPAAHPAGAAVTAGADDAGPSGVDPVGVVVIAGAEAARDDAGPSGADPAGAAVTAVVEAVSDGVGPVGDAPAPAGPDATGQVGTASAAVPEQTTPSTSTGDSPRSDRPD
ncbi:hypothetical protein LRS74_04550 [Streptomyces sp. LX-29]|uniref:hypothetical protein n=1 Tax=Streptomyces sp. LX-29 TaxID=2900152 RepID=UPI00240CE710|nr:hypothetical protein [Streptomyces sp. LX-29]WFB06391.1 hypothetical protein LRS74_04550 [Streptomyces sp. LX-29]